MGTSSAAGASPQAAMESAESASVDAARGVLNQRLMDILLHDVRNPLNAFSINLDVLGEKLRREQGEIPATQEKNLRVMREQIHRMDGILRHFAEFMGQPRPPSPGPVDLSESVSVVLTLLGHESRRAMIKVRQMVEPDIKVLGTPDDVRLLVMQALYRALCRAGAEGEVDITLQRDAERAVLRIRDGNADAFLEPFAHAEPALRSLALKLAGDVRVAGSETVISLPLL